MSHKIGIIGGDGIGPEVISEGLKVIEAAGINLDLHNYDLGGSRYIKDGTILPDSILQEWRSLDALYLGCLLYTSPSPRDVEESRMPSSA